MLVFVAVQLLVVGLYLPPVLRIKGLLNPPHIIISLPVQTAVWLDRAEGALVRLVAVQLSVLGLYLPPVFTYPHKKSAHPPHTIIWLLVHTAV